jgi:hypothetical protein
MRILLLASLSVIAPLSASQPAGFGPAVRLYRPEKFDKLHALIKPQAEEEKFMQIPWMTNLWEARKKAAAQGKPLLLWEMDGHPLGCV